MAPKVAPTAAMQQAAYAELAIIFQEYHKSKDMGPFAIEVLAPGIEPPNGQVLINDPEQRCVGVLTKAIVAAFLHARTIFASNKDRLESKAALQATQIILLFDPEHLTAANFRKRRLQMIKRDEAAFKEKYDMSLADAMEDEIWFLDCILTSPLHRQTKSPTLWYHRYWVLACLDGRNFDIEHEMVIVLRAGERHKHNYYAFQYARRILAHTANGKVKPNDIYSSQLQHLNIWCRQEPGDTSGWSFMLFLLRHAETEDLDSVIGSILEFVSKFDWEGEALCTMLKTVYGDDSLVTKLPEDIVGKLKDLLSRRQLLGPLG